MTKTVPAKSIFSTNLNEIKVTCKRKNFYILRAFLLITMALLIAVSIYYCIAKYRTKEKHLLSFYDTKIKETVIKN